MTICKLASKLTLILLLSCMQQATHASNTALMPVNKFCNTLALEGVLVGRSPESLNDTRYTVEPGTIRKLHSNSGNTHSIRVVQKSTIHVESRDPTERLVELAHKTLKKYGLLHDFANYKKILEKFKESIGEDLWQSAAEGLIHDLETFKDPQKINDIFETVRDFKGEQAKQVSPESGGGGVSKVEMALVGHVDECINTKVERKGVHGFHVSGGTAELGGVKMNFREMDYFPPPEGISAKAWAEQVYGKKLRPLRSTSLERVASTSVVPVLKQFLENYFEKEIMDLPGENTFESFANEVSTGKEVTVNINGSDWSFVINPRNSFELVITRDVAGGFQRVYHHPDEAGLLIKVIDPTLNPSLIDSGRLEVLLQIRQWDLARIDYFRDLAKKMIERGEDPPFLLNGIRLDTRKLERGIAEVRIDRNQKLGKTFDIEAKELPDYIERFREGLKTYDLPLAQIGQKRFGASFSFGHALFPHLPQYELKSRYVERMGHHTIQTDYGPAIVHGLDVGELPAYDNVHLEPHGPRGKPIPVFIDQ